MVATVEKKPQTDLEAQELTRESNRFALALALVDCCGSINDARDSLDFAEVVIYANDGDVKVAQENYRAALALMLALEGKGLLLDAQGALILL